MTTYTYPADGTSSPISGLTVEQVAEERLTHDGATYELRCIDGIWRLFVSSIKGMTQAWNGENIICSTHDIQAAAWADIADQVLHAQWRRVPTAMTDADYQALEAEIAALA